MSVTTADLVQLELLLGESREAAPGEWRADYTGQDTYARVAKEAEPK
jgi:hypothetical protein